MTDMAANARVNSRVNADDPGVRVEAGAGVELAAVGLDVEEEAVWRALVAAPSASAHDVAQLSGVPTHRAATVLDRLAGRGLAMHRLDDAARFIAVRPSVALGGALAGRESELRAAAAAVARLDEVYSGVYRGRQPAELVDVVLGASAVAAAVEQIQLGARQEVLSLVQAPVSVLGSADNTAEDVATARGVTYRVVLEQAMFEEEPRLYDEMLRVRDHGERARVARSVPTKLYVVDHEVALVPLGVPGAPVEGALLVHRSGLLEALVELFEATWRSARELLPPPPAEGGSGTDGEGELEVLDRHVLTLLMAGLTDDAVAKALGLSSRTVQRRVRAMMEIGQVETRLQLGHVAALRDWVPTPGVG